jgi:hypothetical protein
MIFPILAAEKSKVLSPAAALARPRVHLRYFRGPKALLADAFAALLFLAFLGLFRFRVEEAVRGRGLVGICGVLVQFGLKLLKLSLGSSIFGHQVMDMAQHGPRGVHDHYRREKLRVGHMVIHLKTMSISPCLSRGL